MSLSVKGCGLLPGMIIKCIGRAVGMCVDYRLAFMAVSAPFEPIFHDKITQSIVINGVSTYRDYMEASNDTSSGIFNAI